MANDCICANIVETRRRGLRAWRYPRVTHLQSAGRPGDQGAPTESRWSGTHSREAVLNLTPPPPPPPIKQIKSLSVFPIPQATFPAQCRRMSTDYPQGRNVRYSGRLAVRLSVCRSVPCPPPQNAPRESAYSLKCAASAHSRFHPAAAELSRAQPSRELVKTSTSIVWNGSEWLGENT